MNKKRLSDHITVAQTYWDYQLGHWTKTGPDKIEWNSIAPHATVAGVILSPNDTYSTYVLEANFISPLFKAKNAKAVYCSSQECKDYFLQTTNSTQPFFNDAQIVVTPNPFYDYFVGRLNRTLGEIPKDMVWDVDIQRELFHGKTPVQILDETDMSIYNSTVASIVEGRDNGIYRYKDMYLPMTSDQELRNIGRNLTDTPDINLARDPEPFIPIDYEKEALREVLEENHVKLEEKGEHIDMITDPDKIALDAGMVILLGLGAVASSAIPTIFHTLEKGRTVKGQLEAAHPTTKKTSIPDFKGKDGPFLPSGSFNIVSRLPAIGSPQLRPAIGRGGKTKKRNLRKIKKTNNTRKIKKIKRNNKTKKTNRKNKKNSTKKIRRM